MVNLLNIYLTFFKIGMVSYGGGLAILKLMEFELVDSRGWISQADFVDIVAISQVTPGPMSINAATLIGYNLDGFAGSVVATIGVISFSIIAVTAVYYGMQKFIKGERMNYIMKFLRPSVVALIFTAFISISRSAIVDVKSIIIAVVIYLMLHFKVIKPIKAIFVSAILGIIMYW